MKSWRTFQPNGSPAGLASLAIPFMLVEPGSGDSLSMYLGSQLSFQQSLPGFEPGRIYFAPVPLPSALWLCITAGAALVVRIKRRVGNWNPG